MEGGLAQFWDGSDAIGRAVALLLFAMSVASWIAILWKGFTLRRAARDGERALAAFWAAPTLHEGRERLAALDREALLAPLVDAAQQSVTGDSLAAEAAPAAQLTRQLRDALHAALRRLQSGQVLLASVGATAPFVGLFGTVWGIYHALAALASGSGLTIERIAAPVGEALVMTAAGLVVAVPAVVAYNLYSRWIAAVEAELEGFAHDLRELQLGASPRAPAAH